MDAAQLDTKVCTKCRRELPIGEFHRHRRRPDGRHPHCRDCKGVTSAVCIRRNRAGRQEYRARERETVRDRLQRDRLKKLARYAVWYAIRHGRLAPVGTRSCVDCGRRAEHYDHHLGYAVEHRLFVEAVCRRCHNLRGRARGEWQRPALGATQNHLREVA